MRKAWRTLAVAALAVVLSCSVGCTYLVHRSEDALDIVDIGFTFTTKPMIGLYWNSLDIFPVGYSHIDGYFFGWGGGQLGFTRHYDKCYGFGYAYQEIAWGDEFDVDDPETININYAGILGYVLPPYKHDPAYSPACVHFFPHIGFVGLVWNARYMEMVDFVLSWTLFDLAGDDGVEVGHWIWNK
ncbi:MAG: hypothetical protein AMK73_10175 [Planctomycetes bacterium SM23_32]|nr:MAG: hypothetical protein AMK73_10175 [Planctomycetes bacterium SM23_32]